MGKVPVLKPREVISILHNLGLFWRVNAARTSNSVMKMAEAQPFPTIKAEILRRLCCVKSLPILD